MEDQSILTGNLTRYYALLSRRKTIPFEGTFELTPRCNMNCKMCYIRMTYEEMKRVGGELSGEKWIEIAKKAIDKGMMHVLLTGGEAILHPDFKKIYLYLREHGVFVSVNTNATLLNDDWINFFAENLPSQINITVYGGSNATYASLCNNNKGFDQMKEAVEKLQSKGIKVHLNCVITKQNSHDIDKIFEFGNSHNLFINATTYCFPPVRKEGVQNLDDERYDAKSAARVRVMQNWYSMNSEKEFLSHVNHVIKDIVNNNNVNAAISEDKILCAAGRSNFWITWDGRMLICGMIPNYSVKIKNCDFDTAWSDIVKYSSGIRLSKECSTCFKKKLCNPCAAKIIAETGSYNKKPQYLCDFTDEYIRLLIKAKEYLDNRQ